MSYRIAGIDVHKKMLAVVASDVEVDGEYRFERRRFGSNPEQLRSLAQWLLEQEVEEVVMESTAQYWKPVWGALERYWKPIRQKREGARPMSGSLHLALAQSNRGPQGRKKDFPDAERLSNRHMRRILNQSANAAVKAKGTIFEIVYRRTVARLGHKQTIGAIANRQCRLIWLILHKRVPYEERGRAVTKQSKQRRTAKMIRQLRNLGYRITLPNPQTPSPAQATQ